MIDKRLKDSEIVVPDEEPFSSQPYEVDWTVLMTRAQEGDTNAYLRLLQEITPYIRRRTSKFLKDPRDVEDTVQDILLTLHAARQAYDPARPFGPWLVAIANRRAFDRLRRQGRQRIYELPLTTEHEAVTPVWDGQECPTDVDRLSGAIGGLSPVQQQAIRLLKLKEMSLKEAALTTGMSVASLKMATFRALQSLRIRLGHELR